MHGVLEQTDIYVLDCNANTNVHIVLFDYHVIIISDLNQYDKVTKNECVAAQSISCSENDNFRLKNESYYNLKW